MATYIQGQTDYISQIQPTEPNLAFDAQILQTKQTKYDSNHKKVSELYGSLLNSAMTRTDNIQARDEFFKIINDDIRRMGGLDFSLDQNVQAAASVFQSIYENKNIVKDMVWTKNFNAQQQRMEAFKNCLDEEKCGGTYWEEGEKYMQYKRQEFKNASAGEAMNMGDVEFIPKKNVMKAAIKLAKEANLNVEQDLITGDYKVTTKNGELLKSPLTVLFSETLGKDPEYSKMFKVQAFVDRNDWVYSKINQGEYSDVKEAQLGYLQNIDKENNNKLKSIAEDLDVDLVYLDQKVKDMETSYKNNEFKQGSDKYNQYVQLVKLQQNANQAKEYTDQLLKVSSIKNNKTALDVMSESIDEQTAFTNFKNEISNAVSILSMKDAKETFELSELAKMKYEHQYKISEMSLQHKYNIDEEQAKFQNNKKLEKYKKLLKHSSYAGDESKSNLVDEQNNFIEKKNIVDNMTKNMDALIADELDMTLTALRKYRSSTNTDDITMSNKKDIEKVEAATKVKYMQAKRDANEAAVKLGEIPIYRDVLTKTDLVVYNDEFDFEYGKAWVDNSYEYLDQYLKKYNKKLKKDVFNSAMTKADKTKPLYPQLEAYLKEAYKIK